MTKRDVGRVISSEARAAHRHPMTIAFAPREIEYIVYDDVLVSIVRPHSVGGMNSFIVEAFQIDRVRAVNSNLAGIDIAGNGANQTEIFVLIVTTKRSREKNQGEASAVSEGQHFKLAAQVWGVPFDVAFVH